MGLLITVYSVGVVLFITFAFLLHWYQTWTKKAKLLNKFPGPTNLPLIGGGLPFLKIGLKFSEFIPLITKLMNKYKGKPIRVWALHRALLLVTDPDTFQKFLTSVDQVEKTRDYSNFHWILGEEGLVNSKVKLWKNDRKIMTPLFKYQRMDRFLEIFNRYSHICTEVLGRKYKETEGDQDLANEISKFTLDCIWEAFTGFKTFVQTDPDGDNHPVLALSNTLKITFIQELKPWLKWPIIKDIFGYGIRQRELVKARKDLMDPAFEEMKKVLETQTEPLPLESEPLGYHLWRNYSSLPYIYNQVTTIAGAGFKTTVVGIIGTLYLLGAHPKHQEIVHEELDRVLGKDKKRNISQDDLNQMTYLDMCIKEGLRLFPPIAQILRETTRDVKLDDGLVIPSGTDVILMIYQLHHNPQVWEEPYKFNPERFLPEECAKRSPYSWVPFSAGPRNCIGLKYGNPQMRIAVAHILRNFFVTAKGRLEDVKLSYGVSLGMEGTNFTLTPRNELID